MWWTGGRRPPGKWVYGAIERGGWQGAVYRAFVAHCRAGDFARRTIIRFGGVKTPPYRAAGTGDLPANPAWGTPLPGGIYASPTHGGSAYATRGCVVAVPFHGPHACGPYEPARNDRQMGKAGICRRARTANAAQNLEAVIGQQILKSVPAGGHAPTVGTPPGKFCPKLCARPTAECAVLGEILSKGIPKRLQSRAPPAAETARRSRGSGRRAQVPYLARRVMRVPQPGRQER